jgi:hypothetical protein
VGRNVVDVWTTSRVVLQNSSDEVLGSLRDRYIFREAICIHPDSLISGLDIGCFKGRLTNEQGVDNYAKGPNVDFIRVALFGFKDFWSDIVGSTADGPFPLAVELQFSSKSEVSALDFHFVVKEEVANFKVSVNYSMAMQVFQSTAKLGHVALDFKFVETLSSPQLVIQCLIFAQLKQNIDIFRVLKEVLEADNIAVVQGPVNLNFGHQLLLSS